MKKNILFVSKGGADWMGGIYYIKNQIAQLLSYTPAKKNINIYLYVTNQCLSEYKSLLKYKNLHIIEAENIKKNWLCCLCSYFVNELDVDLVYLVVRYRISYIFPYFPNGEKNQKFLLRKSISWIPDFQHIHYPQYFTKSEYRGREKTFAEMAIKHNKLVLSSYDAYNDYVKRYGGDGTNTENVYVIPFCSALNKEDVLRNEVEQTKAKYKIKGNYFIVCNQFWQHKNHMIIFKALENSILCNLNICVVCTGKMQDYRNRGYVRKSKEYIREKSLENNVLFLDLIPKKDQIQLMKGAIAVIQPSLFEGWGTVLEDAKTLRKRVLLSDIPVHREQKNSLCILFNPHDANDLAEKIYELWIEEKDKIQTYQYSVKHGIKYGKLFYDMIKS